MERFGFQKQMWYKVMQMKAFLRDLEIKMHEAENPNN